MLFRSVGQFHDLHQALPLEGGMFVAPVEEEDDRLGILEGVGILRPIERQHRKDARGLLHEIHEQGTAAGVLVLAGLVEVGAGNENDLRQLGVLGLLLERDALR